LPQATAEGAEEERDYWNIKDNFNELGKIVVFL
jgi:hypothetical protein